MALPRWQLLLWMAAIFFLGTFLQPSAAWRDGPEFIVSAWGLGIAHPAGFPLYQSLAWMFEQLPIGNIAFRNHAFSLFCTVTAMVALWRCALTFAASVRKEELSPPFLIIAGLLPLTWLFLPSEIENAIQSEVYALHATITFAVCNLLFHYLNRRQVKYLVLAAFIAGVGCGNHATLGVLLFAFLVAVATNREWHSFLRHAGSALVAGIWGLMVYAYLPIRSLQNPTFDWGDPETLHRFINHVTDHKDTSSHFIVATDSLQGDASQAMAHLTNLLDWFGWVGFVIIIAGWTLVLMRRPRLALMCLIWIAPLSIFFLGWTSSTVLTGALGILLLATLPVATAFEEAASQFSRLKVTVAAAGLGLTAAFILIPFVAGVQFLAKRSSYLPKEIAESEFLALPYRATLFTAVDLFHLHNLHDIDGIRPDVTAIGLGDIIRPTDFKALTPDMVPLLRYPATAIPVDHDPYTHEVAAFLQALYEANKDRGSFYVSPEQDFLNLFLAGIKPGTGLWAEWAPDTTSPNNQCMAIGHSLFGRIQKFLANPAALTDREFSNNLAYHYFAWTKIMMEKKPACLAQAKNALLWWNRWMPNRPAWDQAIYNDLGVIFAKAGIGHPQPLFAAARDAGSVDGIFNLAQWSRHLGNEARARAYYAEAFEKYGDTRSYRMLHALNHQEHAAK